MQSRKLRVINDTKTFLTEMFVSKCTLGQENVNARVRRYRESDQKHARRRTFRDDRRTMWCRPQSSDKLIVEFLGSGTVVR